MSALKIGVVLPHHDLRDPVAVRDYAQAAEALGFTHLVHYDHVLGASDETYGKRLVGRYRTEHHFHEPLVLFGYLAGLTQKIELVTGILILPQRQTALVAKQAAEVDVLSGGRLRLGVGTGWNWVEYEALGIPFQERAARQEEQIRVLRELWTKPVVNFEGRFHKIRDAGLNPLPVQRPIPIWLGGMADAVLERVARLADGWLPRFPALDPNMAPDRWRKDSPEEMIGRLHALARAAGRDPASIGIEGFVSHAGRTPDQWAADLDAYRGLGATHVAFNTLWSGLQTPDEHIAALRQFRAVV